MIPGTKEYLNYLKRSELKFTSYLEQEYIKKQMIKGKITHVEGKKELNNIRKNYNGTLNHINLTQQERVILQNINKNKSLIYFKGNL